MSDDGARAGSGSGAGDGFATSRASSSAEPGAAAVHVITGKAGTGKSTIAGALALRLATGGGRVLLVEVEGRPSIAATLGLREFPREPEKVASALGGGEVHACSLDAEAVLEDYMSSNVGSSLAIAAARRFGVTEFATAIAPGLRDVLLSGYIVAEARRGDWTAVVVDAPPTGRVARFLDVTRALGDIATSGPIHRQAADTAAFLRSASTRVHMVALAEPLPVRESLEALAELSAAALPLGTVVANRILADDVCDAALSLSHEDVSAVARDLAAREGDGASSSEETLATALLVELDDVAARARVQRRSLTDLAAEWPGPVASVPALAGGVRIEGLYDVAELLGDLDHREVRDA